MFSAQISSCNDRLIDNTPENLQAWLEIMEAVDYPKEALNFTKDNTKIVISDSAVSEYFVRYFDKLLSNG